MNRFTRMLMTAGIGLVAGVTIGAGPAVAATSTDQGTSRSESSARPWWGDDDRVVGFFRSYRICDRAGDFGEEEGWWEEYECVRVPSGFHNRRYALVVEENNWGHGWNGRWPGRWVGQWWPGNDHHNGGHWWPRPHRPWINRPNFPNFPNWPNWPGSNGGSGGSGSGSGSGGSGSSGGSGGSGSSSGGGSLAGFAFPR